MEAHGGGGRVVGPAGLGDHAVADPGQLPEGRLVLVGRPRPPEEGREVGAQQRDTTLAAWSPTAPRRRSVTCSIRTAG